MNYSPNRLDVAHLCDLIHIVVPEVQYFRVSIHQSLIHGLASFGLPVLEFQNGETFDHLDICEREGRNQQGVEEIGRLQGDE